MDDLIKRQDAIDAMYKIVERNLDSSVFEDDLSENPHIDVIVDELENLPSAEPKQKTGKWITQAGLTMNDVCSNCGSIGRWTDKYCSGCGARVRGEE